MKRKIAAASIDIIAYLVNDLLGWFIIILFDSTGDDCKFQNPTLHWCILVCGFIHIIVSILCSLFFYKKVRTSYHVKIGKKLLCYNIIMTLIPYLYLLFVQLIV